LNPCTTKIDANIGRATARIKPMSLAYHAKRGSCPI
jgi:hypothetical protein